MQNKKIRARLFKVKFVKHEKYLSLFQLIAFVLVFGLIAGYIILRSFAATSAVGTIEAEQMTTLPFGTSVISDSAASNGSAIDMTKNGVASTDFILPSDATSINIVAKGSSCNKYYPVLDLQIDGSTVTKPIVKSTSWNTYSVSTKQTAGKRTVSIKFNNNYISSSCTRHLYVDKITFIGDVTTPLPTVSLSASPNSISSGGTSTLTWSSSNTTGCTASGGWSGDRQVSGTATISAISATNTYSLSCFGSGGTATASTIVTVTALPPDTCPPGQTGTPPNCVTPQPSGGGTTLEINTTNFTRRYGNCATITPATSTAKAQLRFDITSASACNPASDGHYRTDWSNIGTFTAEKTTCSSIPINFPDGVQNIGSGSWLQFAEAKIPSTAYADWGLYVHNKFDGSSGTEFDLRMAWVTGSTSSVTSGTGHASLWHGGNPNSGWNTFVVCSNYSTTSSGFLNLYLNGVLVRSISGVAILQGQTTDELDINDYTGGSPANVAIHGAPMLGTTVDSVKQAGGWNSAPLVN